MATCCDVWRIEVVGLWIDWDYFRWWRIFDEFYRIVEGKWSLLNDHKIVFDFRSNLGLKWSWWPYNLWKRVFICLVFRRTVLYFLILSSVFWKVQLKGSRQLTNFVEDDPSCSPGHSVLLFYNIFIQHTIASDRASFIWHLKKVSWVCPIYYFSMARYSARVNRETSPGRLIMNLI